MIIPLILCPSWSIDSPPYNLALLKAVLQRKGHEVICYDLNIELFDHVTDITEKDSWLGMVKGKCWTDKSFAISIFNKYADFIDNFINTLLKLNSKVIGFSINQRNYFFTLELINKIKKADPEKIIILGGSHCFRNDKGLEALRESEADAICTGEGEDSFCNILDIIKATGKLDICAGIAFKDKEKGIIIDGGDEAFFENLDMLPFADFSDFKLDKYREKMLPVLIGRGCVNQCIFCSEWVRFRKYRHRSAKNVFEEIKYQKEKNSLIEWFYFNDSLVNADMDVLKEFCSLLSGSGITIKWCGQAVVREEMDLDFLKKLKQVGCQWLSYGVESGSNTILRLMRKKFTVELCNRVIKETREAGMDESFNIIVGFPGESETEFNETVQFVKNNLEYVNLVTLNPLYLSRELNINREKWDIEFSNTKDDDNWYTKDGNSTPEVRRQRLNTLEQIVNDKLSMDFNIEVDYFVKKGNEYLQSGDKKSALQFYLDAQKANQSKNFAQIIDEKLKLCSDGRLRLSWDIHYKCNFRCPYCWFCKKWADLSRLNSYISPDELMACWKRIHSLYGELQIEINGGEPFLYPGFSELASRLSSIHLIKIFTNLSIINESAADAWDPKKIEIIPTFHPSCVSLGDFMAKAKLLKDKGFVRNVLYLAYPPQMQLIKFYMEKFSNENIPLSISPFFGTYNGVDYPGGYNKEEKALLASCSRGHKIYLLEPVPENISPNQLYTADCDVTIKADGTAAYCSDSGKQEIIGNFFDNNFILPEKIMPRISQINIIDNQVSLREKEGYPSENTIYIKDDKSRSEDTANQVLEPQIPRYPRTYPPYRVFWTWDMLYSCNYTCAYCNIIRGRVNCAPEQTKHKIVELEALKDIWDRIFELYYSCAIRLTGGEPSIYPGFIQLVSFLTEKHVVNLNTNLSFDIHKFMERVLPQNVCINVSFHPEFITIEDLMVKLRALMKNGYGCSVCCVGYPPFLKDLERYKKILAGDNIPFNMSPFMGSYEARNFPGDYNEDERVILRKITDDPGAKDDTNKKWLDFRMNEEKRKDKLCRMGQTYAAILPNGDVKRCCSPFTKKIGNIFEKDFKIFDDAMPCDIDEKWNCPCFKAMLVGKENSWMPLWAANEHSAHKQEKGVPIKLVKDK